MIVRTINLIGIQLDYAVAIASGATNFHYDTVACFWLTLDGRQRVLSSGWSTQQSYHPSTNWAQAGPIIEANKIALLADPNDYEEWRAVAYKNGARHQRYGPSALIAAMRCYVTSQLGDEIEIPDCLTGEKKEVKS
jgi:Protein of unknown function (DUF2591)